MQQFIEKNCNDDTNDDNRSSNGIINNNNNNNGIAINNKQGDKNIRNKKTNLAKNSPNKVSKKDAEEMLKWIHMQKSLGKSEKEFIGENQYCMRQYDEKLEKNHWIDFTTMVWLALYPYR